MDELLKRLATAQADYASIQVEEREAYTTPFWEDGNYTFAVEEASIGAAPWAHKSPDANLYFVLMLTWPENPKFTHKIIHQLDNLENIGEVRRQIIKEDGIALGIENLEKLPAMIDSYIGAEVDVYIKNVAKKNGDGVYTYTNVKGIRFLGAPDINMSGFTEVPTTPSDDAIPF